MKQLSGAGWLKDANDNFAEVAYSHVRPPIFVDTFVTTPGSGIGGWANALDTMEEALELVQTGGKIYARGDIREELTGSNLKFDITIEGAGIAHHPDLPAAGYDGGASCWRPPASPTAATPLLKIRGRGWKIKNFLFDCPVDAAAILLERNAESGEDEYDASHAIFSGIRFDSGLIAIENAGGAGFVTVEHSKFYRLSGSGAAGIKCTSTSVAVPLNWDIHDNIFMNNVAHILSSMSYSTLKRNDFGRFTGSVSVDLYNSPSAGQGEYNIITDNYLSGTFNATAYPAGSNNEWAGNQNVAGVTTADPQ